MQTNDFCRLLLQFDWNLTFTEVLDRSGYLKLPNGVFILVHLSEVGTMDHYTALHVRVFSLRDKIDEHLFRFSDYLGKPVDKRVGKYHIVLRDGVAKWYIEKPTTTRALCAAVESYIELFRS